MIPRKPGRQASKQGTSFCMHQSFFSPVHTRISLSFQHHFTRRSIFGFAPSPGLEEINKDFLRFLPFGADESDVAATVSRNRMHCCPQQVKREMERRLVKPSQSQTRPTSSSLEACERVPISVVRLVILLLTDPLIGHSDLVCSTRGMDPTFRSRRGRCWTLVGRRRLVNGLMDGRDLPFLRLPIPHDVPQAFVAGLDA
jgi:hypothetical protein